jgi:hypothetical protein
LAKKLNATQQCSLCKSPLLDGAVKCIKCGGFQGKWFFLNLSIPTLSMLVALVSVLSLSITLISPMFEAPQSDLRVAFQYFENGKAYFVASNVGSRPASVGEAWFDFVDQERSERHYLIHTSGNRYITPAASQQLSFAIQCENTTKLVHYQNSIRAGSIPINATKVVLRSVRFDGSWQDFTFPLDQRPGLMALIDTKHECLQKRLEGVAQPSSAAIAKPASQ